MHVVSFMIIIDLELSFNIIIVEYVSLLVSVVKRLYINKA